MIIQKIHYHTNSNGNGIRLCHQDRAYTNTTKDMKQVTCKKCLRIIRAEKEAELRGEALS